jgi:chemotaxis protein histidine kinase CheA
MDMNMDLDFEAMIRRAEMSVANLAEDFAAENARNVAALRDFWIKGRGMAGDAQIMRDLFRTAHDIKGQGTTFGYELLSIIAASLCTLLTTQKTKVTQERVAALIEAHVTAIELVTNKKITGAGGRQGEELVDQLQKASAAIAN